MSNSQGLQAVIDPGLFFRFITVITLVSGTIFLVWLGEQITQRGIGNGISLIIFTGIVAQLPVALVLHLSWEEQEHFRHYLLSFCCYVCCSYRIYGFH